jgi:peptide/nickel transport system permease protein
MARLRTLFAFGLVLAVVVLAVFAPIVAPSDPFKGGADALLPPGSQGFVLGSDHLGRDILSELIFGARVSLAVGISAALSASILGIIVGSLAGFFGGWVDGVLMRLSEFFQTLPRFVLALVIVAFFGGGVLKVIIVLAILSWPQIARLVRAQILSLREATFVDAARLSGMSSLGIIAREILPNALAPGGMLNVAQPYLHQAWWMAVFPGVAISLVVLSFNILGDALNDALNPRLQETA